MPMESAINLACSLTPTRPLEHLRALQTEHVTMFEAIEARYKDAARVTCAPMSSACKRIFDGPNGGTSRTDGALVGKILIPEIVANVTFGGTKLNRLFICGTTCLYSIYVKGTVSSSVDRLLGFVSGLLSARS